MTGGEPKMDGNYLGTVTGPMSQLGQKRKSSIRAHVFRCSPNNGHRSTRSACPFHANTGSRRTLFDHLVGRGEQGWRHCEVECLCRLEIYRGAEFGRPHDRQFGRLLALEDIVGNSRSPAVDI